MARVPKPRHVTIMLIPHFGQRTYQIKLPLCFFRRLFAGAILCVALLVGFGQAYSLMRGNMDELSRLRRETVAQRSQLESLAERAAELREREARVAALEQEVRALIESDQFLPAHVKANLLRGLQPGDRSRADVVPMPEQAGASEPPAVVALGPQGGPASPAPPVPDPAWRRTGPLASRAGARAWSAAAAGSPVIPAEAEPGEGEVPSCSGEPELGPALDSALGSGDVAADRLAAVRAALEERQDVLLSLPQCMPTSGRLTSRFGYRRSPFSRAREFHAGVDLAAPRGTPVWAVADGVVVFCGRKPGLGNTVILEHGHGISTLYGHNSRLMVRAGQRVKMGQVIALVGDTGRSTGDHLHFELHFAGHEVDPWPYLVRLGG